MRKKQRHLHKPSALPKNDPLWCAHHNGSLVASAEATNNKLFSATLRRRRVQTILPYAEFMADSQVPWGIEALSGAISQPAWKTKPS